MSFLSDQAYDDHTADEKAGKKVPLTYNGRMFVYLNLNCHFLTHTQAQDLRNAFSLSLSFSHTHSFD